MPTNQELEAPSAPKPFKAKLTHAIIVRAPGLLPMLYRPSELADELDVDVSTVLSWVHRGLPHTQDELGHFWVNGRDLARWVTDQRAVAKARLQPDEAYCLGCRTPVVILNPTLRRRGKHVLRQGACPLCGNNVNRGVPHGE